MFACDVASVFPAQIFLVKNFTCKVERRHNQPEVRDPKPVTGKFFAMKSFRERERESWRRQLNTPTIMRKAETGQDIPKIAKSGRTSLSLKIL